MDNLLCSLFQECGAIFNNTTLRSLAFHLVLFADSSTGLQLILDHTVSFLNGLWADAE